MKNPIKAKPVSYNGVDYRSTLEARWARFFTEAKIDFNYEPGKYSIDNINYIPDFGLNNNTIFVEIKPSFVPAEAFVKASSLARTLKTSVFMFMGDFWDGYIIWRFNKTGVLEFDYKFLSCPQCNGKLWLTRQRMCPICKTILYNPTHFWKLRAKKERFEPCNTPVFPSSA